MRVVVSGTHATGKSNLVADLAAALLHVEVLHAALLDLLDDPDLVGGARVVDVAGEPPSRLAQALRAVRESGPTV